jgi:hypothetical protein
MTATTGATTAAAYRMPARRGPRSISAVNSTRESKTICDDASSSLNINRGSYKICNISVYRTAALNDDGSAKIKRITFPKLTSEIEPPLAIVIPPRPVIDVPFKTVFAELMMHVPSRSPESQRAALITGEALAQLF